MEISHYEFPMRPLVEGIKFDFSLGVTASESGDLNNCFLQLINDNKADSQEISIFTDGSRMMADDGNFDMGCSVVIPCLGKSYLFKLNRSSSSYTSELIAMIKAMDTTLSERWTSINICFDSLSALSELESTLSSLFPFARTDLGPSVMNLSLMTAKLSSRDVSIRFTWCPAHIGKGNEMADICAKSVGKNGIFVNNLVFFKEIISTLGSNYKTIDSLFIDRISQGTGSYYMNNFRKINVKFVESLTYKRRDYTTLLRVLTGYANTYQRLFRMSLVESPACCGFPSQDLNHFFGLAQFWMIRGKDYLTL